MPSASSVVDHFEAAALKDEFDAAVEHLTQLTMASTTLDGPELTEAVERRLFSLHARVTRGVPPAEPPAKADEAEQWAAWDETRAMSAEAAQQEYIDLVRRHTAGFDALDELDGGGDGEGGGGGGEGGGVGGGGWKPSGGAGGSGEGELGGSGAGAHAGQTTSHCQFFGQLLLQKPFSSFFRKHRFSESSQQPLSRQFSSLGTHAARGEKGGGAGAATSSLAHTEMAVM